MNRVFTWAKGVAGLLEASTNWQVFFSLWASSFFPLWWLIGNELREFNLYYVVFANVVALTTTIFEWCLITLCRWLGRKSTKRIYSHSMILIWVGFIAINLWTFAVCTLELRLRYTLALSGLAAFIWLSLAPRKVFNRRMCVFFVLLISAAFFNSVLLQKNIQEVTKNSFDVERTKKLSINKNIYVLVFDSLISKSAYKNIYGRNQTPWSLYLKNKGFRVIDDAESAGDLTVTSFGTLYSFGAFDERLSMTGFNNPVYKYFKENGYKTAFLIESSYFGIVKGSDLDYLYPPAGFNSVCSFAPPFFLLNACQYWALWPREINGKDDLSTNVFLHAIKGFVNMPRSNQKWLTTVYTWYPGHSPIPGEYAYDGADSTAAWHSTFESKVTASVSVIDRVVGEVLLKDRNAIIFVFGDHGSWNFRGVPDEGNQQVSGEKVHLDKYGVTFAVYPKTLCPNTFKEGYKLKYLFNDLIACLGN